MFYKTSKHHASSRVSSGYGRQRKAETRIYAYAWMVLLLIIVIDAFRDWQSADTTQLHPVALLRPLFVTIPCLAIFLINNSFLIPRYLFRNQYGKYVTAIVLLIFAVLSLMAGCLTLLGNGHPSPAMRPPGPRHIIPMPLFLGFGAELLVVGANIAVAMIFRDIDNRIAHEQLLKTYAEEQLAFLKQQINPHFYLNMLNNIHGMIEIDSTLAQDMIIRMSGMMRYMLYDCTNRTIPLSEEIAFLDNYVSLMRCRYPEEKLTVTSSFPTKQQCKAICIPPLLFLVFIENSFKHGVSYRRKSRIDVSIKMDSDTLSFTCVNTRHEDSSSQTVKNSFLRSDSMSGQSGIGLQNISRRLNLLYGQLHTLEIDADRTPGKYQVRLNIPLK